MHRLVKKRHNFSHFPDIFMTNIFQLMLSYAFLTVLVLDILNFFIVLFYVSRKYSFSIFTPTFHKWVKIDPHEFPMEINYLNRVVQYSTYFVNHISNDLSITTLLNYFTQQEVLFIFHIFHHKINTYHFTHWLQLCLIVSNIIVELLLWVYKRYKYKGYISLIEKLSFFCVSLPGLSC